MAANESAYDRMLRRLRENDPSLTVFSCEEAFDNNEEFRAWTNEESVELVNALTENTTVVNADLIVDRIPLMEGAPAFVEYVGSSHRLCKVIIRTTNLENHNNERKYLVDQFLRATVRNPGLKELCLCVFGTSVGLFDLLSTTKTLTRLRLHSILDFEEGCREALVAGLIRNQSLKRVDAVSLPPPLIASCFVGLCRHPTLEHLFVNERSSHAFSNYVNDLVRLLHCAQELTQLDLKCVAGSQSIIADSLFLAHADYCNLKRLRLQNCQLGEMNYAIPPVGHIFPTLETIKLINCTIRESLQPLMLMTGLKEVAILKPRFENSNVSWSHLIRSKPNLQKLVIDYEHFNNNDFLMVVQALYRHESLQELCIKSRQIEGGNGGDAIQLLLSQSTSLEKLILNHCRLHSAGATLVASGLQSNRLLQELVLVGCNLEHAGVVAVLSAVEQSSTLRRLVLDGNSMEAEIVGPALEAMLCNNDSLSSLSMNGCSLLGPNVLCLVEGIKLNNALKTLDIRGVVFTAEDLAAIGQSLEINASLEKLHLGKCEHPDAEDTTAFFRTLAHMHGLKTLRLDIAATPNCIVLLLHALQTTNETLESFDGIRFPQGHENERKQVDFFMKLNRLGRRLLGSPDVPAGLWPNVLERMTGPSNLDALFYFLRDAPKKLIRTERPASGRKRTLETT